MIYDLSNVDPRWLQDVIDLCGLPQITIDTCNCEVCGNNSAKMRVSSPRYLNPNGLVVTYSRVHHLIKRHDTMCDDCFDSVMNTELLDSYRASEF